MHTSALQPTSQYKSLVISEETTSDELLSLLLSSYNSNEPVEQFSLYEVSEVIYAHNKKKKLSCERIQSVQACKWDYASQKLDDMRMPYVGPSTI